MSTFERAQLHPGVRGTLFEVGSASSSSSSVGAGLPDDDVHVVGFVDGDDVQLHGGLLQRTARAGLSERIQAHRFTARRLGEMIAANRW